MGDPEYESKKSIFEMMKKKTDIFGFGTVLLYVLTGHLNSLLIPSQFHF